MNRFSYSLTLSLLCCTVVISPSQAQQVVSENTSPQGESLAQIAEDQDLPIALLEDNQAFIQEEVLEQQDAPQAEPSIVVKNQVLQQEIPAEIPLQTSETAIISETSLAESVSSETPQEDVTSVPTPDPILAEKTLPEIKTYPIQQTESFSSESTTLPEEAVSDNTPQEAAAPLPEVIANSPTESVNDLQASARTISKEELQEQSSTDVQAPSSEPEPTIQVPPAQFRSSAFSLNEKAPIPSKLFGDNGFAPSMMDKKISISPEQRAQMMMKKKYDEMDFNRDGVVSEDEFIQYKTEEAQKISREIFKHVDINKDGIISEEEYEILMKKMIDSFMKQPSAMPGATLGKNPGIL